MKRNIKRALISSALALFLSFGMLIGTTFAWFTDSASSTNNILKSGSLDIALDYKNSEVNDWTELNETSNVFKSNTLWEPGHVEVVDLRISNKGTLALKYQFGINIVSEVSSINADGEIFKLSDYVKFGIVDAFDGSTRELAINKVSGVATSISNGYFNADVLLSTDVKELTMVVYIPSEIGNEINHAENAPTPTINLGINLIATQVTSEEDTFGGDFDNNAWTEGMEVRTASDLQSAIENSDYVEIKDDIVLDSTILVPKKNAQQTYSMRARRTAGTVINLNGKKITSSISGAPAILNYGDLMITGDGIIENTISNSILNEGNLFIENGKFVAGSYAINNQGGNVTVENLETNAGGGIYTSGGEVTINGGKFNSNASGKHVVYSYNADLTINDGEFHSEHGKNQVIFGSSSNVTINDGVFTTDKNQIDNWTTAIVSSTSNSNIVINDGDFNSGLLVNGGNIEVNGGTFNDVYGSNSMVYSGNVTINGGIFVGDNYKNFVQKNLVDENKLVETENGFVVAPKEVDGTTVIVSASELKDAFTNGGEYVLMADVNVSEILTIASNVNVVIDLNSFSINGISSTVGANFNLIDVRGTATFKNGTLSTIHVGENMGWNSSTNVFNVTAGGVLNIENAEVINYGGSDMAFGVHLNNWGEVTLNAKDVVFKSTYVGVRVFNSGYDNNNVTLDGCEFITDGACFWVHNYTAKDFGASYDEAKVNARLNFNFSNTSFVRNGSKSLLRYGFSDAIYYSSAEMNEVVAGSEVALKWALSKGKNVLLSNDLTIKASKGGYSVAGIVLDKNVVLDGNGYTLTVEDANDTYGSGIYMTAGTVKNITVKGSFRGIFTAGQSSDLYIDNVSFEDVIYTFNSDDGNDEYAVYISNSTLSGWTSFSNVHKEVVFTNCTFSEGSGYAFCRPYNATKFIDCTFMEGYVLDTSCTNDLVLENCKYGETVITQENAVELGLVSALNNAVIK